MIQSFPRWILLTSLSPPHDIIIIVLVFYLVVVVVVVKLITTATTSYAMATLRSHNVSPRMSSSPRSAPRGVDRRM